MRIEFLDAELTCARITNGRWWWKSRELVVNLGGPRLRSQRWRYSDRKDNPIGSVSSALAWHLYLAAAKVKVERLRKVIPVARIVR